MIRTSRYITSLKLRICHEKITPLCHARPAHACAVTPNHLLIAHLPIRNPSPPRTPAPLRLAQGTPPRSSSTHTAHKQCPKRQRPYIRPVVYLGGQWRWRCSGDAAAPKLRKTAAAREIQPAHGARGSSRGAHGQDELGGMPGLGGGTVEGARRTAEKLDVGEILARGRHGRGRT